MTVTTFEYPQMHRSTLVTVPTHCTHARRHNTIYQVHLAILVLPPILIVVFRLYLLGISPSYIEYPGREKCLKKVGEIEKTD